MSGHSKWSTIKHKKALNDAKKGKIFSKYAQLITASARESGGDTSMNANLRLLVEKAKAESMPVVNIQRAIDRGTGKSGEGPVIFEAASYEGFGPEKVAVIVDVLTENKNRAVAEIRNIFNENGGNMADSGAVSWNFEQKGLVTVRCGVVKKSEKFGAPDIIMETDPEKTMIDLMEIDGVLDIQDASLEEGKGYDLFTKVEDMGKVRDAIYGMGYIVKNAELVKISKMNKNYTKEQVERIASFLETLDEYQDVQNIWTDVDPDAFRDLGD